MKLQEEVIAMIEKHNEEKEHFKNVLKLKDEEIKELVNVENVDTKLVDIHEKIDESLELMRNLLDSQILITQELQRVKNTTPLRTLCLFRMQDH